MTKRISDKAAPKISTAEVKSWLSKHKIGGKRLKPTKANLAKYRNKALRAKLRKNAPIGQSASYSGAEAPWQIIYGDIRVSGALTFVHTVGNKQRLDIVVTLAGHEITAVDKLFLDDNEIVFGGSPDTRWSIGPVLEDKRYNDLVFMAADRLGGLDQTVQADLNAIEPGFWTANHRQRGHAHVFVQLKYDALAFASGFPVMQFQARGKKVYDPRTGLTAYSNNSALIIADYLTDTRIGLKYPWSNINAASLISAADICDEDVALKVGGTEKRYTINTSFLTSDNPDSILQTMIQSMAGSVVWSAGQWHFSAGAYKTPTGVDLTIDDLRSSVSIECMTSANDNANSIRGTFHDASKNYDVVDYPAQKINAYIEEDGGEIIYTDIPLACTTSASMAQRIARIDLEKLRRPLIFTADFSLKAFALEVGDVVTLTMERYGFSAKTFEVLNYELDISDKLVVTVGLVLQEVDAGIYSWTPAIDEQTVSQAPATTLPIPSAVNPPTGLSVASGTAHLHIKVDGTVASRLYASWIAPDDIFVVQGGGIEVEYKKSFMVDWITLGRLSGTATNTYIYDVADSTAYDVRVRAVNTVGSWSAWATVGGVVVVGKTEPPTAVTSFTAVADGRNIKLQWTKNTELDFSHYQIKIGTDWDTAEHLDYVATNQYLAPWRATGSHTFLIKAFDTSGNASSVASAVYSVVTSSVSDFDQSFLGRDVVFEWSANAGSFLVEYYAVRWGSSFEAGVNVFVGNASSYKLKVDWTGSRTFWLASYDGAGNASVAVSVVVAPVAPAAPTSLTAEVIDNNALLKWTRATGGSLEVDRYKIYKGDTFGASSEIGSITGTFFAAFENTSGRYTYWITTVDSAGNESSPASVSANIQEPQDYVLLADQYLSGGTCTNAVDTSGIVLLPVVTGRTWAEHFTDNGWTTIQDQIDDGYDLYLQPEAASGSWVKTYDYGTTVSNVTIRTSYTKTDIVGTATLVSKLAYSTDGSTWTEENNVTELFCPSIRYARVTYEATSPGIIELSNIRLRLDVKQTIEYLSGTSSNSGPTSVSFTKPFIDVDQIMVTAKGTAARIAVYDFVDVPNPTSFDVYVFDAAGAQVVNDFSAIVIGVI